MKSLITNRTFLLLTLICVATLLPFVGLSDFHTKGEPREAIVSFSMLDTGNWILPRNNGGEMAYKPPFFHWCIAAVSALWGEVNEITSRLPSAIALIVMTLAGYAFYARRSGSTVAVVGALVAWTSFELHRAGANCRVDMVLTALIVGSVYGMFRWYERGMRGVPWGAVLMMGLGTMTKGPVGSVLPCLVMGVFMLLRGCGLLKALRCMMAFGLLSLVLYAVWFYAAWQYGGQEFLDLMYDENIGRMTGTMSYKVHVHPWPFNFGTVAAGYLPWTLLLVIALFWMLFSRSGRDLLKDARRRAAASGWRGLWRRLLAMSDTDLYSLTAIVVIFVFYCLPESKRSVYLMPIYPFIGYFIARWLLRLAAGRPCLLRVFGGTLSVLTAVLFVAFVAVRLQLVPESIFGTGRHAGRSVAMLHALESTGGLGAWMMALVPTAAGLLWWRLRHATGRRLVLVLTGLVMSVYMALDGFYTPTVLNTKSLKAASAAIDRAAPESQGRLYEYMEMARQAQGDPLHFFEINFYLHNRIGNFFKERPEDGFLLISKADAELRFGEFEADGYRFELCWSMPERGLEVYRFRRQGMERECAYMETGRGAGASL